MAPVFPAFSAQRREGVRFKDFYASAIATGPAFTSLITGLFPVKGAEMVVAETGYLSQDDEAKAKELEARLLGWLSEKLGDREDPMPVSKVPWTCYIGNDLKPDSRLKRS